MQTEGLLAAIRCLMGPTSLSKILKLSLSSEKSGYAEVSATVYIVHSPTNTLLLNMEKFKFI